MFVSSLKYNSLVNLSKIMQLMMFSVCVLGVGFEVFRKCKIDRKIQKFPQKNIRKIRNLEFKKNNIIFYFFSKKMILKM